MTSDRFYLKQQELGPMQNYVYFVGDAVAKETAVIDPGWEPETILRAAAEEGLRITLVIATHYHFDHVNAVVDIIRKTGATLCVNEREIHTEFADEVKDRLRRCADGEMLTVGHIQLRCIHTPGHTPGSQCILAGGRLFTGDTLFVGGCGRTDLPGGSSEQLFHSLHHVLSKLPGETRVYPGHNYASEPYSTIAREREDNVFFQQASREDFTRYRSMKTLGQL